jgi:hypothetical protein
MRIETVYTKTHIELKIIKLMMIPTVNPRVAAVTTMNTFLTSEISGSQGDEFLDDLSSWMLRRVVS